MARVERLGLYEPKDIVPLAVRSESGQINLALAGNSILSLLYVSAIDPGTSVRVEYFDTGVGASVGELNLVGEHPTYTAPTEQANRILVTRLTNKTVVRWTIQGGGDVYFGVYAYVVNSFASDLDNALKLNAQTVDFLNDKGIVVMGYDQRAGAFYYLPMENGALLTTPGEELPGTPRLVASSDGLQTTPGIAQDLVNEVVPSGESWRIRQIEVLCRHYSRFTVYADGQRVASGRNGPTSENVTISFKPYEEVLATKVIRVEMLQDAGGRAVDVECYVRATNHG